MNKPKTWKELLQKNNTNSDIVTTTGHCWKLLKKTGGKPTPIRTYSDKTRTSKITGVEKTPIVYIYRCANCGTEGSRYDECDEVIPNKYNRNVLCTDILIKEIII